TMSYDGFTGDLLSIVADAGTGSHFNARTSFAYNGVGQVLTTTDPLGTITKTDYDNFGNLTSVTRDFGPGRLNQLTTLAYNARGTVTSVTDPNGNITTSTYDATRRPIMVTTPATRAAPVGVVTASTYDPDGRAIQIQQAANNTVLRTSSMTYTPTGQPETT